MKKILKRVLGVLILAMIIPLVFMFIQPNNLLQAFIIGIIVDFIGIIISGLILIGIKLIVD